MSSGPVLLKDRIRSAILNFGFDSCGFTNTLPLPEYQHVFFKNWLEKKYHANMRYMEHYFEQRMHPDLLVKGAKSIIAVAVNYFPNRLQTGNYRMAKYAYGFDYHDIIKEKLREIIVTIPELNEGKILRIFTDSAPVAERFLAVKAGLGFIGKNNAVILPDKGSYFFLAEIFTDIVIPPDKPFSQQRCGSCMRCLNACPTGALNAPYSLDARKCISYATIESKEKYEISFLKEHEEKWIFGCDICLDVCPWNRFASPCKEDFFTPNETILQMNDDEWENMTETFFQFISKKSPLKRAGYLKLKQNIAAYKKQ